MSAFLTPFPAKRRERRHPSEYEGVRRVTNGVAYQARMWVTMDCGGSWNLGLFTLADWGTEREAEWAAGRAWRAFDAGFRDGVDACELIGRLKAKGIVPSGVEPKYAVRRADGLYDAAVVRKEIVVKRLPGVFPTARRACLAMYTHLGLSYPRPELVFPELVCV